MGTCNSKDGGVIPPPQGGNWNQEACFAAGGHKWTMMGATAINPNSPCGPISLCNGTNVPSTQIGGKVCGAGNKEFLCIGSAEGGNWNDSGMACDEGAAGACPTSCGAMTLCGGERVMKSKIGAKECGEKNLTYVCGPDGKWVVGGTKGDEKCDCMTICPDIPGCEGNMEKQKIGAQICGVDRKTRICEKNMIGPPSWTYGKKCACPGDPADPPPVVAPTPAAAQKSGDATPAGSASTSSNTTIIISAFVMLFMMIMIVVLVFVMRGKKGRGEFEGAAMPMREELFV